MKKCINTTFGLIFITAIPTIGFYIGLAFRFYPSKENLTHFLSNNMEHVIAILLLVATASIVGARQWVLSLIRKKDAELDHMLNIFIWNYNRQEEANEAFAKRLNIAPRQATRNERLSFENLKDEHKKRLREAGVIPEQNE